MISLIIPAYNSEKYIKRCLESVFSQVNSVFEVIVVNDGSIDNTAEICKEFLRYRNFIYEEQSNEGQGAARNRAIELSHGEWLMFLDSDDEMCEGCMISMEECIKNNPKTEVIQYEHEVHFPNGNIERRDIPDGLTDKLSCLKYTTTFLWDKVVKKDLWNRLGVKLSNRFGEDIKASYLCAACAEQYEIINEVYVKHFIRDTSLSCDSERVKELPISLKETVIEFEKNNILDCFRSAISKLFREQIWCIKASEIVDIPEAERIELENSIKDIFKTSIDYELILIGMDDFEWVNNVKEVLSWGLYDHIFIYETLDKFIVSDNSSKYKKQIYLIDISHESLEVKTDVRSLQWIKARFIDKTKEFCEKALTRGKPQKILVLDEDRLGVPMGIFGTLCETVILHYKDENVNIYPCDVIDLSCDDFGSNESAFWNKGEQYRYEVNEVILAGWLKLKNFGVSLAEYFRSKRYSSVCIYGMGYIGQLLYDELSAEGIDVSGLMENKRGFYKDMIIWKPDDFDYNCDVIVVTLMNVYYAIRHDIFSHNNSVCIVSIEDVVSEMISEVKNCGHT